MNVTQRHLFDPTNPCSVSYLPKELYKYAKQAHAAITLSTNPTTRRTPAKKKGATYEVAPVEVENSLQNCTEPFGSRYCVKPSPG